ncbi:unnamed protein product [Knipowitschia caucasica]
MSSYFVNSFSGRYANDYQQLLNYGGAGSGGGGGGSGTGTGAAYRDPTAMHHPGTAGYGYGYNGMDLSVSNTGRSGGSGAFGGGEGGRGFVGGTEPRGGYSRQGTATCSLTDALLSPRHSSSSSGSGGGEDEAKLGSKQQESSGGSGVGSLCQASESIASKRFTDLEEPDVEEQQQQQQQQKQVSAGAEAPQIFPWMRKLHISHGTAAVFV